MNEPITIDRLALRGGRGLASRRRALWRLERADPAVPGPPAQVLVVRRLDDPLPGALGQAGGLGRWETAASERLGVLSVRAVRPAHDGAGAAGGAEAVVFADEAEMLACLAERMATGAPAVWWARTLARRLGREAGADKVLAQRLDLLPAICDTLLARGTAVKVLDRLTPAEAETLCTLLGADATAPAASPAGQPRPSSQVAESEPEVPAFGKIILSPEDAGGIQSPDDADRRRSLPQVGPRLTSAIAALSAPTARLLAVAWLRRRRPTLSGTRLSEAASVLLTSLNKPPPPADLRTAETRKAAARSPSAPESPGAPTTAAAEAWPTMSVDARHSPGEEASRPAAEPSPAQPSSGDDDVAAATPDPEAAKVEGTAQEQLAETGAATALGGLFFLVNLFDGAIAKRATALLATLEAAGRDKDGAWTALERLARALLAPETAEDDAVWRILATLDGREPDDAAQPGPADVSAAAAACDWIAQAGWGEAGPPAGTGSADLLGAPARIFLTAAHLDVIFPADAVSLPARRAGLDLDPGWRPRFGRVITFHFRD